MIMETIRLICYSTADGSKEGVYFTDDFEMDADDAVPHGCTLDSDTYIEVDKWPMAFPMNYNLERTF